MRFWWDRQVGTRKMAWVAWSKMALPKDQGGLDFRDIQSVNDAHLAKLGWRIINNPESLLSRILIGKYCNTESFLTCPTRASCSHGWRSILVGRDVIMNEAGWAVGNGSSLNIWESAWLNLSDQQRPMGPAPEQYKNLTVSDLFLPGKNEWNVEKIQQVLPYDKKAILSIRPSLTGAPDKLMWLKNVSGEYSTKSGYTTIITRTQEQNLQTTGPPSFDWKKNVWNLHVAPKIQLFLWKIFHGALPVGEQLRARQILVDGKCKSCGLPESIDHLFLHCSFSQQVWRGTPVTPGIEISGSLDLRSIWENLFSRKNLPPTGVGEGPLAPWILWHLWLARNNLVFNDHRCSSEDVRSKAIAAAREWNQCQQKPSADPKRAARPLMLIAGAATVRSDAAWNEVNQIAGLGWTINDDGVCSSFSAPEHFVRSPLMAEGLALRRAILQCKEIGISKIRCESDSSTLIKSLNLETSAAELYGVVTDIIELASSFDSISFVWIPRERNVVADGLAKLVLSAELAIMAPTNIE